MNNFEQYTLIIGLLAVLFEGLKLLKEKIGHWLHSNR